MKCPKCGNINMLLMPEYKTKGKDFHAGTGCCGAVIFGPIGILCGLCGKGKRTVATNYWYCTCCNNKFKA